LIKEIGEDPKQYSSHSFRRGGATWAFSSNIPSELIQLYGDTEHPLISVTYLGIEAERIVPIFLLKTLGNIYKYKHLNI
jgi:hypothetical protein